MRRALAPALHVVAAAVGALLLAIVLAALLLVALTEGFARERLREALEARLSAATGASVRIGALEGRLVDRILLRELEIEAETGAPLRVAELEIEHELARLWRERVLAVTRLRIAGLRAEVERVEPGWRISGLAAPLGGEGAGDDGLALPFAVEVAALAVEDAGLALFAGGPAAPTAVSVRLDLAASGLRADAEGIDPWALAFEGRAALGPSTLAGRALEAAELALHGERGSVTVTRLAATGPFGRLAGEAELRLGAGAAGALALEVVEGRVAFEALDLAVVAAEPGLASQLAGEAELGLAAGAPRAGWRLALEGSRLGDFAVRGARAHGWLEPRSGAWRVEAARLEGAFGALEGEASGRGGELRALALRSTGLELAELPRAWLPEPDLAGRVRFALAAEPPWTTPLGRLRLDASALAARGAGPAALALELESREPGRIRVEELALATDGLRVVSEGTALLEAERGAGVATRLRIERLVLSGAGARLGLAGGIAGDRLAALRVEVAVDEVSSLAHALGVETPIAGSLTGELVADGPLGAPALDGRLALAPAAFGAARLERIELALAPDGSRQRADARLVDGGVERLQATLSVSRAALAGGPSDWLAREDSELVATAEGLALDRLAALAGSEARVSGTLDLAARARGGAPEPTLAGTLRLAGGALEVPGLATPFGPIEGEARFAGSKLLLDSLRVESGGGELHASGTAALHARGTAPEVAIGGRIELSEAHVQLADPLWREIEVRNVPQAHVGIREGEIGLPAALHQASADVEIAVAPDTWVEGRGLDLRLGGELRVLKSPGEEPLYLGSLQVTEGRSRMYGRRFEIERGVATLVGTRELDPELDIVAEQEVGDVTLRVVVSGRASAPVATFESEPPLDPADQLAYLAFGRPASALDAAESLSVEATATAVVGQLVLQGAAGEAITGVLPIDELAVTPAQGERGPSVGAIRRLGRRVSLRYARDLVRGADRVRVEWRFLPSWSLETEADTERRGGADVIWSFEY